MGALTSRHRIRSRADVDRMCLGIYGGPLGITDPVRARIAFIDRQERQGVDMGDAMETAYLEVVNGLWVDGRIGDEEHEQRVEAILRGARLEYLLIPSWPTEDDFPVVAT